MVSYVAQSLYAVMTEEINKTWPIDLSKIKSPVSFNKNCLVKGLNIPGSFPWGMRSRIAVQSQSSLECPTLSYI